MKHTTSLRFWIYRRWLKLWTTPTPEGIRRIFSQNILNTIRGTFNFLLYFIYCLYDYCWRYTNPTKWGLEEGYKKFSIVNFSHGAESQQDHPNCRNHKTPKNKWKARIFCPGRPEIFSNTVENTIIKWPNKYGEFKTKNPRKYNMVAKSSRKIYPNWYKKINQFDTSGSGYSFSDSDEKRIRLDKRS